MGKIAKILGWTGLIFGMLLLVASIPAYAAETALTSSSYDHVAAAWSPDGQWVVYVRNDASGYSQIWKVAVTGGAEIQLTFGTLLSGDPAWAPDDSAIAYKRADVDGYTRIYTVPPSGGPETLITTDPEHYQGASPNWSPDSTMLTFAAQKNPPGLPYVCTAPATGGNSNWLVQPGNFPVYSHSGDRIAYRASVLPNPFNQIWTIPAGGGPSIQLTFDDFHHVSHNWSFSDNEIVYYKNVASGYDRIFSVSSTGGSEQPLTPDIEFSEVPSYSPNDNYILFQKGIGINWQIFFMRSDGSDHTPITNDSYNNVQPRWAPNGLKVLYLKTDATGFRQIYISGFDPGLIPIMSMPGLVILSLSLLLVLFYMNSRRIKLEQN